MSRLALRPLPLPAGVTATATKAGLQLTGPKGTLVVPLSSFVKVTVNEQGILVQPASAPPLSKEDRAQWGTAWALIRNAVVGVTQGYQRQLELQGVGYRADLQGNTLRLSLGFTHPTDVEAPNGITFRAEKNVITVSGIDKYLVGEVAASLRRLRPPEPYKGKGIRYVGEVVRRKAGKVAGGTGAAA